MNSPLVVAVLKVVKDFANASYDRARADLDSQMGRGDRLVARSPRNGKKLATVSKADPEPRARVVDGTAFRAWVAERYPEALQTTYEISGSTREVIDVLFVHAGHLLRPESKVDPEFVRMIKEESAAIGVPVGPGGETEVPGVEVIEGESYVSALAAAGALDEVIELFRDGQLSLESLAPRELPGGGA